MFGLSISELLNVFLAVIKYAFLAWLGSFVIQWVWRSLIVPIFQRRAYFYIYKVDDEGFYIEKPLRILWHRLWRNKRWALQTALIGYVAKRTGGSESDAGGSSLQAENDIFFTSLSHKTHVGQVKSPAEKTIPGGGKMRICEVILKRSNVEGDKYYDAPVGFINDKGEVFKYYRDRKAALKGQMLQEPVLPDFSDHCAGSAPVCPPICYSRGNDPPKRGRRRTLDGTPAVRRPARRAAAPPSPRAHPSLQG